MAADERQHRTIAATFIDQKGNQDMKTSFVNILAGLLNAALVGKAIAQGSLTPPGAPAPTMKTLDQIEARTPIDAIHTPGDGSDQFLITNAGSYYLTTNITGVAGKNGIRILADNVTLDLNGFELDGAGAGNTGIQTPLFLPQHVNITIRNGAIRNWLVNGVDLSFAKNMRLEKILVSNNGANGLLAGENAVIRECSALTNAVTTSGAAGIVAGAGSMIAECTADSNGIGISNCFGIIGGTANTIAHCSATQNNSPNGGGISSGFHSTVVDCSAALNNATNAVGILVLTGSSASRCTANLNIGTGGTGIVASQYAHIVECNASSNGGDGIRATNDCAIIQCLCANNSGAGIHTTGVANRIDGNDLSDNLGNGVKVDGVASLVVRNSARGSGVNNYVIAASNNDAERMAGSTGFTSTDPWANFSY
jgi:hypothetical protein